MSSTLAWGLNKCKRSAQECNGSRDRISELPEEILVLILSLLKLKEAARTSVLARRWRNLWTRTVTLNFDYSDEECDDDKWLFQSRRKSVTEDGKLPLVKRPQFVALVNKVLSLHQGFTIDEFEVSCKLYGRIRKQFIDEWLEFALRKKVKKLKLDFSGKESNLFGNYSITKPLLCKYNLDNLTVLCLEKVDVTGKVLQHILFRCHRLEVLRVNKSYSLMKLKVPGPLPQLKCLDIKHCIRLKCLKICAINIESFTYHGPDIPVTFNEVPRLVQASIGGSYASFFVGSIGQFSSNISHLVSLELNLTHFTTSLIDEMLPEFPILENLRQLKLALAYIGVESIMNFCASVLKKCPNLRRLLLKANAKRDSSRIGKWSMEGMVDCLHSRLEVLELVDFRGEVYESFIACSVVERLPSLQHLILHPLSATRAFAIALFRKDITLFVERLRKMMPPGAELTILW